MSRGSAEVGYWTHPDARGHGLMTEAVGLLAQHAFASADASGLELHRLFVRIAAANSGSLQVALRNGFVHTGSERRSEILGDGSYTDMVLLDLLRNEWKER